ncbi:hypothetical protein ACKAV7_005376 [Fusarium commune]
MALTTELTTPVTGTYQQPIGLYIGGKWVEGAYKKKFDVINPSTEEVITSVCLRGRVEESHTQPRGAYLHKLADIAEKNLDLLASVESLNNGKSITNAPGHVGTVVGCLRYYGGWADKIEGKTIGIAPDMFHYTRYEPIGVCGRIIPWNFPLLMLAWKIGPTLATGNTTVMKTSEQTPLSALVFTQYIEQAGFPSGVFNLVSGYGKTAGAALSAPDEGAIVVTGGERLDDKGYFIKPSIFSDVRPDMKIMQEEIFGPVCAISKFKDVIGAIALAHDTNHGLAAIKLS